MAKKVRTAKGQIVDFELFKIKESLSNFPTTVEVKARERFIENKMKRKLKKAKNKMLEDMKDTSAVDVVEDVTSVDTPTKRKVKKIT